MVSIVKKLLQRRTGMLARVYMNFFAVIVVCTKQMSWALVHAGVYVAQVLLTSEPISTQSLQGVHMRSCMRSLFIRVGGRGCRGSASLCRVLVAWRRGLFLTEGETGVLPCVFSIFDAGERVCVCVNLYTHTHTHTAHGVLDVSPVVGTRHLEGPKNPDGLNLGIYVFVNVYKVNLSLMHIYAQCELG